MVLELAMVRYMAFGVLLKKKKKKKANKQTTTNLRSVPYFGQKKHLYIEGLSLETSALETL